MTNPGLDDVGTCHDLTQPARSLQIIKGSAAVVLYSGADCTGQVGAGGSLAQSNLPFADLRCRVVDI
ncbi:hypothetical protein ACF07V_36075 [Streptomyces sp. NPDC015661]|uniref:hypothetical protein n=1 Tax=Streptomyces sp. NPDC015661 TaxID=3364961 RepID=UPI0036F814D9